METLRTTICPTPAPDYFLLQLFTRDADDRMTLSTFSDPERGFEWAMNAAQAEGVNSWQLRRWDGVSRKMVMIAVSANWFLMRPKAIMQRREPQASEIVDGLRVETGPDERVCIYFSAAVPRLHDTYLKISRGKYLQLEGNVTPENYQGFLRAVQLAPRYMTNP